MSYYPPTGFYFKVQIAGASSEDDAAFTEVSGLDMEIEVEEIKEGGENGFTHRLPGRVKYSNLVLKRGILVKGSQFAQWCQSTLRTGPGGRLTCKDLDVFLLDENGNPLLTWSCSRAWPVKWSVGAFDSTRNEVAVETLEFAYRQLKRR
ncbi:phage tail protein [Paraburkholderia sp. J67]|uniref:phage tail protein n=1 Tax=Paraburkholderia sp. J67 TaxID=2805435 RepID=UPI002ABDC43C|nr:phage tail protein [Paraburkholderia sp. J67]